MAKQPRKFVVKNPKDIFDYAEAFIIASDAINKSSVSLSLKGDPNTGISLGYIAHVNHAFAFELYLKCLMSLETGYYYEGHDLLKLFRMLKQETQDEIIKNHDSLTIYRHPIYHGFGFDSDGKFIELLTEAADAFVDFRYIFNAKQTKNYDLSFPLMYLKGIILKRCPHYSSDHTPPLT